jgi:hypothetical protein
MPYGIAIFCTDKEIKKYIGEDSKLYDERWNKHIAKLNYNLTLDDDREELVTIPVPSAKHTFCGVCENTYDDYISHINSHEHFRNTRSDHLYNDIDIMIEQLDSELFEKQQERPSIFSSCTEDI